jgi:hypothetical protein
MTDQYAGELADLSPALAERIRALAAAAPPLIPERRDRLRLLLRRRRPTKPQEAA